MAITDDSRPMIPTLGSEAAASRRPARPGLRAALEALAAGQAAAADFRRLEAMTPGQMRARGLSRAELPQELFRRHFARLPDRSQE